MAAKRAGIKKNEKIIKKLGGKTSDSSKITKVTKPRKRKPRTAAQKREAALNEKKLRAKKGRIIKKRKSPAEKAGAKKAGKKLKGRKLSTAHKKAISAGLKRHHAAKRKGKSKK